MKVRNDYVSNSSSCSFIVKVNNDDDIAKVRELVKRNSTSYHSICVGGYPNLEYASDNLWDYDSYMNEDNVQLGELLKIDVGEDHDLGTIDKFYKVSAEFEEAKLELYADDDAHYTIGNPLPDAND